MSLVEESLRRVQQESDRHGGRCREAQSSSSELILEEAEINQSCLSALVCVWQKAIKEKEFELVTVRNQKLESLCRALQDERKNLYEKLQKAAPQPQSSGSEAAEEEVTEASAAPPDVRGPAAPAGAPSPGSPLARELVKVKAEQARLKEIASAFTVSHVLPAETVPSQSQRLSDGVQQTDNSTEEVEEDTDGGEHQRRELEMESVD